MFLRHVLSLVRTDAVTPEELAGLAPDALSRWLLERARDARLQVREEDLEALDATRRLLRSASEVAAGVNRDLIEVADAFFRINTRATLGLRERAAREFLKATGKDGEWLLDSLVNRREGVVPDQLKPELLDEVQKLAAAGVVCLEPKRLSITPEAYATVREFMFPLAFRHWEAVDAARRESAKLPAHDAALTIAARVGSNVAQATRFLQSFPLTRLVTSASGSNEVVMPSTYENGRRLDQKADGLSLSPPDEAQRTSQPVEAMA